MKENNFFESTVMQKELLAAGMYKITISTDNCSFSLPGQYAIINVDGKNNPFQVCDFDSKRFTIVASEDNPAGVKLCNMVPGDKILTQTGLGNGFDIEAIPNGTWLVADRKGIPEMLELARILLTRGKNFRAILEYRTKEEVFMVESFRAICNELEILTLDGSNGREGSAADAVRKAEYVCASGSLEMLKSLSSKTEKGQFSFSSMMTDVYSEENNTCENTYIGENMETDGPVFDKCNINWDMI